ncbi:MAG TPA: hypothetical protein VH591_02710, partial [Ktedonobacterales bacterium]
CTLIIVGIFIDVQVRRARAAGHTVRSEVQKAALQLSLVASGSAHMSATANREQLDASRGQWETEIRQLIGDASGYVRETAEVMASMSTQVNGFQVGAESIARSADTIGQQAGELTTAVTNIEDAARRMASSAGELRAIFT